MKIWEFTNETTYYLGIKLTRIKRISDGLLGGYIEKESNLSEGTFVFDNARVFGDAQVSGNAQVFGNARVSGEARVSGNAHVSHNNDYITLKIYWLNITITKELIQIGCKGFTKKEWLKKYKEIAKNNKVNKKQTAFIKSMVLSAHAEVVKGHKK